MYEAAQLQRRVLRDQLSSIEGQRDEIASTLRNETVTGVDREGLEQQLRALDVRILDLRQQLADAQLREAQAAAVPGATERTAAEVGNSRFEGLLVAGTIVTVVLGLPLVLAYARRLWKRAAVTVSMTPELDRRLDHIDRALDATAVEVERIGEGQRFVTQLLAQRAETEPARLPETRAPQDG
jgi:hypothetical protein